MPEPCTNILIVTASTDEAIKQLKAFVRASTSTGSPFAFSATFPIPEVVLQEEEDHSWCYQNWGTEEARYPVIRSDYEGLFEVQFETIRTPPVAWMEKISRDYPLLQFINHYDDIDKKSSIEGQNGRLYDDGRKIKDISEVKSNLLKEYEIGTILKPSDKVGQSYPFTIQVTGPGSAIVEFEATCNAKYREGNIHYSLYHKLLQQLIEKREKEKGDVILTHESDGYGGYYFTLCYSTEIMASTVADVIEKSLHFMDEIHQPLDEAIKKREASLSDDIRKELELI